MVYWSAGDLGVVVDFGRNQPGDVLQRRERGEWHDFKPERKPITAPVEPYTLPPGDYRLVACNSHIGSDLGDGSRTEARHEEEA